MVHILHKLIRPLIWSVIIAMALYSATLFISDLQSIGSAILRLSYSGWLIILSLSLTNYGLRFLRWQMYLKRFQHLVPFGLSLAYYLGGFAFTTTPGKSGELIRSHYLQRHGVSYMHSMSAFFTERFLDLIVMLLLALSSVVVLPNASGPVIVLAILMISLLPLLHSESIQRFIEGLNARIASTRIQAIGKKFLHLIRSASNLLSASPLSTGLLLGFFAWLAEGIAFYLILVYLGVTLSPLMAISIYALSVLAGALSLIPGGLGTTEAAMGGLLMLFGVDTATAIAATFICRLSTLWFAVGIGFIMIIALEAHTGFKLNKSFAPISKFGVKK